MRSLVRSSTILAFLFVGCGTKLEPCGEGLARADDGNCYQYRFTDTGSVDNSSGLPPAESDGSGNTGGTTGGTTGNETGGTTGGGSGGETGGSGPTGGDPGGGNSGDPGGSTGDPGGSGGDPGGSGGGGDMGGDMGGGDMGGDAGGDPGGGVDGGSGPEGEEFSPTSCSSDADCSEDDCPPGGTGCGCQPDLGECMPTCSSSADCDEGMECFSGFCEPSMVD